MSGLKHFVGRFLPKHRIETHVSIRECNDKTLSGLKIIITGGGKGLGYAIAQKFVDEGAEVLITGRNEDTLKKAACTLGCRYMVYDVLDFTLTTQFISKADVMMGGVDVLVNNAGVSLHEPTMFDVTPEGFNKQIDTNFKAPYFLSQAFLKYLLETKRKGQVLFISSETGETDDFRPYGFTKAAINSMVRGLAFQFRHKGIRINAVAPGVTASDMSGVAKEENLYAGDYGQGRYYLPEEVAEVAAFLISPLSGCVSGQIITCNNAQTVNARWKR